MAERPWKLNDIAPLSLAQEEEAAAAEGTWGLSDSAPLPLAQTFATAAAEWAEEYWGPGQLAFNVAEEGGVEGNAPVTGSRVNISTGVVTATGAANGEITGRRVTIATGTVIGQGAANTSIVGTRVVVSSGIVTGTGAAQTLVTGERVVVSSGTVVGDGGASGDAFAPITGERVVISTGVVGAEGDPLAVPVSLSVGGGYSTIGKERRARWNRYVDEALEEKESRPAKKKKRRKIELVEDPKLEELGPGQTKLADAPKVRIAASASVRGIRVRSDTGLTHEHGAAAAQVDGVAARALTGRVRAIGYKNPTEDELALMLLAA